MWTYEKLTLENLSISQPVTRENSRFQEDQDVPKIHRSILSDYQNSGFDRGHICPARDQASSEASLNETFYLSNICPQNPVLNRGLWKRIESHARNRAKECKTAHIYTGSVFMPRTDAKGDRFIHYSLIGKNDVAVPTHFFKVIFAETENRKIEEAFLVPNEPLKSSEGLEKFMIPLEMLEKAAGIIFPRS